LAKNPSGSSSRRDPFITMVEAAEFRDFYDHAMLHGLTLNRALFSPVPDEDEIGGSSESARPTSSLDDGRSEQ
jgi:hypothetical protein